MDNFNPINVRRTVLCMAGKRGYMVTIFCIALKQKLEESLKTSTYIDYNINEDIITITIHSYLKPYRYTFPDISNLIVKGVTTCELANEVLKGYRHYVLKYFFK